MDLTCTDGVTSLVRNACYPGPCTRTDMNTSDVDSGDNYTVDCATVSPLLLGDVFVSCYAGVLTSNSSGCKGHCNASQSDSTRLHGQMEQLSCRALDSNFDGSANGTCVNGVMSIDSSTCVPACPSGQTIVVSVAGVSHTVALQSRVSSGNLEQKQCSSIDATYYGSLGLACSRGVISANNSCHKKCLSSASVQVAIGGTSYAVSPSADILHSQSGQVACSAAIAGYSGSISLSCSEGVLTAGGTGCLAYCAAGTSASVTFSGLTRSVVTPMQIGHGSTGILDCSSAEAGFNGSLTVACSNGQVSMQSQTCFESPCSQPYQVQLGGSTSVLQLGAQMKHGESISEECSAANVAYDGNITATCIKGSMVPNYAACVPACLTSSQLPFAVGSYQLTVSPDSRMANGEVAQKQCSSVNADLEGSLTLRCVMGSLSLNSACVPSCLTSAQTSFTVGIHTVVARPSTRMANGASEQQQCADSNSNVTGTFTLRCESGSVIAESHCAASCLKSYQAPLTVNPYTLSVSPQSDMANGSSNQVQCASVHAGLEGTLTLGCQWGKLSIESNCAASCLTSFQAPFSVGPYDVIASPSSRMLNGSSEEQDCSDLNMGLEGNFTLRCQQGTLTVDSACEPSCPASAQASFTVGSYNVTASPDSRMANGASAQKQCSALKSELSGTVTLRCVQGYFRLEPSCAAACLTSYTAPLVATPYTLSISPNSTMANGSSEKKECSAVHPGLEGNLTLLCDWGNFTIESGCVASCLTTFQAPFTVGTYNVTASPDSRMANGSSYQKQCSTWNKLFGGNLTLRCDRGNVVVDNRCTLGCPANNSVSASLDGSQWHVVTGAAMAHNSTQVLDCPSNFTGSLTMQCITGAASVLSQKCVPLPCVAGTSTDLKLGPNSRRYNASALVAHRGTVDMNCSYINETYEGSLVVECMYGVLGINSIQCAGIPCDASPGFNVQVGWKTLPVAVSRLEHSARQNLSCSRINSEFAGEMYMRCDGGNLLADTSTCVQMEVGCLPAGQGFSVRLAESTYLLHPSSPVDAGDSWQVDCSSIQNGWVGTLNATCGSLGSITADDSVCAPKSCSAGQGINVTRGVLRGVASLPSTLAHGEMASVACSSVDEGLQGNLQLSCNLGQILEPNLSTCAIVCLRARPVQATFGGMTHTAFSPADIDDGKGLWMPCQDIAANHSGDALLECKGGRVDVDASRCMPLPCASQMRQISVGGIDFQIALNGSKLGGQSPAVSGFNVSLGCEVLSLNLAGTFKLTCLAGTFDFKPSCTLAQCPAPGRASSSQSSLSTADESGRLILNPRFVHNCGTSKVTGQTCNVSCGSGWQGSSEKFMCWLGGFNGSLPMCALIPVKVEVKGTTKLQVSNPAAFVRDPFAKKGVERQIAKSSGVNASSVNATLSLDDSTAATGGRRLATAVKVDYVIVQQVQAASPAEATSLAANIGLQITTSLEQTSDEDMAAQITQAIVEVARESNVTSQPVYQVQILEREVQPMAVFSGETAVPMENITNFTINTTKSGTSSSPSALVDSEDEKQANWPLIIGLIVGFIVTAVLGLILGAYSARAAVRRQLRVQDEASLRQAANMANGLPALDDLEVSSPQQPEIA
eukprot:TRINITY_DN1664_c0_g4_i2.p1 TRINITY_DN1664_c0_g4~~TRINITY_DN1664_c0_g4_i2.p1  ORF type:complete len:1861 (-),score=253.64 TRINITY_DN1664_c0_g4_i2:94-4917(-)